MTASPRTAELVANAVVAKEIVMDGEVSGMKKLVELHTCGVDASAVIGKLCVIVPESVPSIVNWIVLPVSTPAYDVKVR